MTNSKEKSKSTEIVLEKNLMDIVENNFKTNILKHAEITKGRYRESRGNDV